RTSRLCPYAVASAPPPSSVEHHESGGSPIGGEPPGTLYPRGSYVLSSTDSSTCTLGRGLVRKLYHSSRGGTRLGSAFVAAVWRSSTSIVATWNCEFTEPGWSRKYAP